MKNLKNIIFDFDGVIFSSDKFYLETINKIFGLDISEEEWKMAYNTNTNISMRESGKFKKIDWEKYDKESQKDFPLLKIDSQVKEVLEKFSKKYKLFIITSGHKGRYEKFLENNRVDVLFEKLLGFEEHKLKGPKFKMLEEEFGTSPEDSVFVTDSTGDIFEAREVGYKSIGITTGVHHRDELERFEPLVVVDDFKELEEFVENDG